MRHLTTILSSRPARILSTLSDLRQKFQNHTLLFALSSNAPDLSNLVSHLTAFSKHSVGCLSAQLPVADQPDLICCSLAVFDSRYAIPFRSSTPGRTAAQVGRWHSFRKRSEPKTPDVQFDENTNWEDVWSKRVGTEPLPRELQGISPPEVKSVVYFSDDGPEGLINSFHGLPDANKLGMIASSTPFVTGRPFTLFFNDNIYSSGAVGLALMDQTSKLHIDFPASLQPITPALTITRSEGNLVHEVDKSNPTRILLGAIENAGIENSKDDKFYLSVLNDVDEIVQVYHVTSGDPSRGTISLESHAAPNEGVRVQLCHKSGTTDLWKLPVDDQSMQFVALSREAEANASLSWDGELSKVFVCGSENGIIVGRRGEVGWKCTVEGGVCSIA